MEASGDVHLWPHDFKWERSKACLLPGEAAWKQVANSYQGHCSMGGKWKQNSWCWLNMTSTTGESADFPCRDGAPLSPRPPLPSRLTRSTPSFGWAALGLFASLVYSSGFHSCPSKHPSTYLSRLSRLWCYHGNADKDVLSKWFIFANISGVYQNRMRGKDENPTILLHNLLF